MITLSIIGRLGKDATVNEVNGKKVINFSVCHSQKNKEGIEKSTWVECAKWGETTGVAPYLKKGTQVFVEGLPDVNVYDKKDGSGQGASLRVMVNKIELLGGGEKSDAAPATSVTTGQQAPELTDDLPF